MSGGRARGHMDCCIVSGVSGSTAVAMQALRNGIQAWLAEAEAAVQG